MGFPVQHLQSPSQPSSLPYSNEGPQVSPATLALLTRSLPPDKLRILITTLFSTFSTRQQTAVGHVLIRTIPVNERVTELLKPRRELESALPAERVWANEQVEKSLAEGTAFNLVPSMNVSSGTGPANLSWVWRSSVIGSTQTREAARETFFENQRERARGRLDPQPDRRAIVPSSDSVGGRSRPEQVLNVNTIVYFPGVGGSD
jgi:hypothetical protein